MIKVLPIKKDTKKYTPKFVLETTIGYGEHCCDTFTHNRLTIVESAKDHPDSWNYIDRKVAEEMYLFFGEILNREECDHITLNDLWKLSHDSRTEHWYKDFMDKKEMKKMFRFYQNYETLFSSSVEYNWYGLVNINIYYYDENGDQHNCMVVPDEE